VWPHLRRRRRRGGGVPTRTLGGGAAGCVVVHPVVPLLLDRDAFVLVERRRVEQVAGVGLPPHVFRHSLLAAGHVVDLNLYRELV
jgi:hypothetical protein